MLELLPPLNDKNLPWLDVIHPIVVHFVIAMALISVVFDLVGVITRRRNLFEVSFWNLVVATVAIFVAIIFGQIEAVWLILTGPPATSSTTTAPLAGLWRGVRPPDRMALCGSKKIPPICLLAFS